MEIEQGIEGEVGQEIQSNSKKPKKTNKEAPPRLSDTTLEISETKAMTIKITFEGEVAKRILKCESDLRERLSKPDMGKIIGAEILTWTEKRWAEMVEENTDIEFYFAQIRKCSDKSKSIKLLKALSEKLKSESPEGNLPAGATTAMGLSVAPTEEAQSHSDQTSAGIG